MGYSILFYGKELAFHSHSKQRGPLPIWASSSLPTWRSQRTCSFVHMPLVVPMEKLVHTANYRKSKHIQSNRRRSEAMSVNFNEVPLVDIL